jgi:hypothetical protein
MTKIIEQPAWAVISGLLLCVLIYLIVDRIIFIKNSEAVLGKVVRIESYNCRCGGGRNRRSYPCTRYIAHIKYPHFNGNYSTFVDNAGGCRGSDEPITCASFKLGESIDIIYDLNDPERVYQGTLDVWQAPRILFIFQIAAFGISLIRPKKRRRI